MLDQIRPPTDNLYKFLALSGLALLLAAGWAHIRVDLELFKFQRDAESTMKVMTSELAGHLANEFKNAADDIEKGKVRDEATLTKRVEAILASPTPNEAKHLKQLVSLAWERGRLLRNNDPERILLRVAMLIGLLLCVAGFVLWYQRVQRPLDEILQSQVREAREKSMIETKNPVCFPSNETTIDVPQLKPANQDSEVERITDGGKLVAAG